MVVKINPVLTEIDLIQEYFSKKKNILQGNQHRIKYLLQEIQFYFLFLLFHKIFQLAQI